MCLYASNESVDRILLSPTNFLLLLPGGGAHGLLSVHDEHCFCVTATFFINVQELQATEY